MTKSLLILGCGGHGRVVADVAADCGYDEIAFLDDDFEARGATTAHPVLGPFHIVDKLVDRWPNAISAVGNNSMRLELFKILSQSGYKLPAIMHPSAVVSRNAGVSDGVFVAPMGVINTGAQIGMAVIVNTGARIDHDCIVGAGSHIAPGTTLSGSVTVGERAWLGTGCSVRQGVTIGSDTMVGVGAAVVSNIPDGGTYVGVPARPLINKR